MITQLADDFRFSGPEIQICSLTVRVADLAERSGCTLVHWDDQELGAASSIFVKFESGRVAALTEHAHLIKYQRAKGPIVEVEARDVVDIGVASFVDEVLGAFRLSREDTDWIAPDEDQARAADLLANWALYRTARRPG